LCVPTGGQFEQLLNARYLQHEGYGMAAEALDSPRPVQEFFDRLDEFAVNLKRYSQDGNRQIFEELDGLLDRAAARLL